MRKLILLALTALMMIGCGNERPIENVDGVDIETIDSCEYIRCYTYYGNLVYPHKGNCKFCAERDSIKWEKRKAELIKELRNE